MMLGRADCLATSVVAPASFTFFCLSKLSHLFPSFHRSLVCWRCARWRPPCLALAVLLGQRLERKISV